MKVLVTGGAGYIGSVATEKLLAHGYEVVVLDSLYMGHRAAVHPGAAFVQADLADKAAVAQAFQAHRPDAVMHFASHTLVGESMQQPFLYLGDNVRNALNLLEVMTEQGVGKIILSSTANLFDRPERMPIGPEERVIPGSPYGESKAIIERLLHWLHVTKGLRYGCLRYFNAAGATEQRGEDHTPETHLIPLVLQVALGQRPSIKVFGGDYPTPDGTCVRDYVHIADLAEAHILTLQALETRPHLTYNLGNGNGFSVKEVIDTARAVSGRDIPVEIVDRRPGDPAILVADASKIKAELGWSPRYADLPAIVESAWKWHVGHPGGYGE